MKRFMIPRTAHCSSGCQFLSWVRRETARISRRKRLKPRSLVRKSRHS